MSENFYWGACSFTRNLIAPGFYQDLKNIEGVSIRRKSDCYSRGEVVVGQGNLYDGEKSRVLRICLERRLCVCRPDPGSGLHELMRKVDGLLRSYGIDPVIASFAEAGFDGDFI